MKKPQLQIIVQYLVEQKYQKYYVYNFDSEFNQIAIDVKNQSHSSKIDGSESECISLNMSDIENLMKMFLNLEIIIIILN